MRECSLAFRVPSRTLDPARITRTIGLVPTLERIATTGEHVWEFEPKYDAQLAQELAKLGVETHVSIYRCG